MKLLKIHSLQKGWCDKDHVMLHAAFQLLVDFVEKERPEEIVDWNSSPEHKRAWRQIRSLYKWWSQTRPARKDPLAAKGLKCPPMRWKKLPGSDCRQLADYDETKYPEFEKALRQHRRLEKQWEEEDQRNLHCLVEVRGFLWT